MDARSIWMLKKILLGVVGAIAVFAVVVALQPSDYKVTRSASMAAPQERVFSLVNDFHYWEMWSPWAKLDPNMKTAYEGPTARPGSVYKWNGNDKAGEGQMTILDSRPDELIRIKIDFTRPFPSSSSIEFRFAPVPAGTEVTWSMSGENNFMGKAAMLFMGGFDKAVGPDFERGLAQLKAAVEKGGAR